MTTRQRKVTVQPPAPWLVLDGETCAVTKRWVDEFVGSKKAYTIAVETWKWVFSYDADEYITWYTVGVLSITDRLQDAAATDRLLAGLKLLADRYPRAVARAQRDVRHLR